MLSVYQHWDPLQVCAVGRTYPPEFYSFVENSKARSVLERIAIETEEDYQKLIKVLQSFGVKVIRTDISDSIDDHIWMDRYSPPPMTPRDHTIMLGDTFFMPPDQDTISWPDLSPDDYPEIDSQMTIINNDNCTIKEKEKALSEIRSIISEYPSYRRTDVINEIKWKTRCINHDPLTAFPNNKKFDTFKTIREYVGSCGNKIVTDTWINSSTTTRIGSDLYYATVASGASVETMCAKISEVYNHLSNRNYRSHIVNLDTHSDAVFTPVVPGLVISISSPLSLSKAFPDWEILSLPNESWQKLPEWKKLRRKNAGKWWVPGEELNDDFTDFVETWLNDWVLYVEETVFDLNILIIDENNVIVNGYSKPVFDAFQRHNVTPHIVNFRHRYFWDGGLHCITSDLSRTGVLQDFFPQRSSLPAIPTPTQHDYF